MFWASGLWFLIAIIYVDDFGSLVAGAIIGLMVGAYIAYPLPDKDHDPSVPTKGLYAGLVKPPKSNRKSITSSKLGNLPVSLWESEMWPPPEHAIDHGGGLSFTYADANGEVTERRIISWKEDPEYDHCFTGWCTDREEPRTFRIDRVQSWG